MCEPCDNCGGSGTVLDTGWMGEYPDYITCPDCRGSGTDYRPDPDEKFEREREEGAY